MALYRVVEKEGLKLLNFEIFSQTGLVEHAFTTRSGGVSRGPYDSLNMAFHVGDQEAAVLENRRRVCSALGAAAEDLVAGRQVHGTRVCAVSGADRGKGARDLESAIPEADGLVTGERGLLLSSYYADCVPVMILDPVRRAIGLAHAGWKGTVGHIAGKTVLKMVNSFHTRPKDCLAVIAPSIGPCCYEVDSPVLDRLKESFGQWRDLVSRPAPGRWHLDLWRANQAALLEAGLLSENIAVAGLCTACHPELFYSYRGQSGVCGRMASLLMLR